MLSIAWQAYMSVQAGPCEAGGTAVLLVEACSTEHLAKSRGYILSDIRVAVTARGYRSRRSGGIVHCRAPQARPTVVFLALKAEGNASPMPLGVGALIWHCVVCTQPSPSLMLLAGMAEHRVLN